MGGCRPTAIGWATLILLLIGGGLFLAYQRFQGAPPPLDLSAPPLPTFPSITLDPRGQPNATPATAAPGGAASPTGPGAASPATGSAGAAATTPASAGGAASPTAGGGRGRPGTAVPPAAAAAPTAVVAATAPATGTAVRSTVAAGAGGSVPSPAAVGVAAEALYDAFASYLPLPYAAAQGLMPGVALRARGAGLDGPNLAEAERFQRLKRGEYVVLPSSHAACALFCDEDTVVLAIVDESAGADEVWVRDDIRTFNDLAGRRIAFADRSVSHAMLLEILNVLQVRDRVTLVPTATVDEALEAFKAGRADAVVAWQPNTLQQLTGPGGQPIAGVHKLTDTSKFRLVLDLLIFNRRWVEQNPEAAQSVMNGWFLALKAMQENPDAFAATLAGSVDPNWSGVRNGADLRAQLEVLAQATLAQNRLALEDPSLLARRIAELRRLWSQEGQTPPSVDPARLVDNRFVMRAYEDPRLAANAPPVNPTFTLASRITLPRLTPEELGGTRAVAQLPVERIDFAPDSFVIQPASRAQLDAIAELLRRTPGLYLQIEGRAAKPRGDPPQETIDLARDRANAVRNYLATQPGVDPDRLLVTWPRTDAELRERLRFYDSTDNAELEQDRIVIFTLRERAGR